MLASTPRTNLIVGRLHLIKYAHNGLWPFWSSWAQFLSSPFEYFSTGQADFYAKNKCQGVENYIIFLTNFVAYSHYSRCEGLGFCRKRLMIWGFFWSRPAAGSAFRRWLFFLNIATNKCNLTSSSSFLNLEDSDLPNYNTQSISWLIHVSSRNSSIWL